MSNEVIIKDAVKRYGDFTALNGVSLDIREGEFFTLLGPSGCGKTTLLRMIAGFNSIEGGDFYFGEKRINDVAAHKRDIGMVFQNYAIFPHLTVRENVAYGLKARKTPKAEIETRVEEALAISDRIAVMKDGNIMQIGTPNEIYAKPQNPFVAGFIGVSNFMECEVAGGENGTAQVTIQGELAIKVPVGQAYTGAGKISARPEQLFFSETGMPGKVLFSTFLGDFIEYEVELDNGQNLIVNEYTKDTGTVHADGERVHLSFDPARISLYRADTEEVLSL